MGGGLLQLVAYGAQDVYLTGNPQITFFKVAYRRHTNFALEAIEQTFNGNPTYGSRVTCQISRNGDLINRMYLEVKPNTSTTGVVNYYGLRLINYVEIEIGGQKIDKHYSYWLYVWNELTLPKSKRLGYNEMVGAYGGDTVADQTLYIPLEFWFCRNIGLALPLIALQYHEVKININFESRDKCKAPADSSFSSSLWVDYIFLDTDERRRFAQLSHEYLIEQIQFTGQEAVTSVSGQKTKLNFNHPCKELVWFLSNDYTTNKYNNWFNFTTKADYNTGTAYSTDSDIVSKISQTNYNYTSTNKAVSNPIKSAKLVLNGNDRFYERPGRYFNLIQPFQHHENIPVNAGINVYSFALKPEEHQPSGTLNMSRIDTAVLNLTFEESTGNTDLDYNPSKSTLHIYAVNYNVLRILSGMGGLAYSN
jgi:Large eukaryotic DNA virus major capsid protein/Major capsid protein N-terminus